MSALSLKRLQQLKEQFERIRLRLFPAEPQDQIDLGSIPTSTERQQMYLRAEASRDHIR